MVFTNLPNLCDGQTATLRAAAVPGAQDYQWTLPVSFLTPTTAAPTTPGGNVFVTSSPELQVTAHANRYDYGGVSVTLAVSGSGCGASAKTQSLIVGLGYRAVVGTSSPTSTYYSDQVCANQPIQFSVDIEQQTTPATNYTWTVNGNVYFPAQGAPVLNTYTPPAGQSLQVMVTIDSPCGSLTTGRYLTTAGSVDGQPCDNYRTGRPQPTAAYPNPADNKLYVEQSGGTVTLRNSHSQLVLQEVAKPGRAQLNTNHLPTGLYFLEFTGPDGARVRQQIRIEY